VKSVRENGKRERKEVRQQAEREVRKEAGRASTFNLTAG